MLSCSFDIIALMHLTVAVNGEVYDPEIHSDEIGRRRRPDIRRLHGHKQEPLAVLALYQIALTMFSIESLGLALAHHDRNEGPAFERQQGNTVNSLEGHQALVIRDAGVFPESGAYAIVAAVGFADLGDATTAPDRSLVIYQMMYGKKQTSPCPMCTAWLDSFNGVAHHLAQNIDLAVVAAADPSTLRAHARNRCWDKLRLLSAGDSTFKYDLGSEDREGNQDSTISVFTRDSDGALRHFYSVHPRLAEDIEERGIDEYNPIWNVLDLTPQGRGDWAASLKYGTKAPATRG
jgi:predicted dithiol-disulfide oxidoreductase (DUF899 family)